MSGQLASPSVTSPRAGDRSRASRVSPGNATGRLYARQHEEAAKRQAASVDIPAIRHDSYTRGHAQGYKVGFQHGWDALADHLVEIGVLDPDPVEDQDGHQHEHREVDG